MTEEDVPAIQATCSQQWHWYESKLGLKRMKTPLKSIPHVVVGFAVLLESASLGLVLAFRGRGA